MGIKIFSNEVYFPTTILPKTFVGKYSLRNVEGAEVTRKDLPMITKTYYVESPNYGDWSRGTHDVYWDRDVYVREYIAPRLSVIEIELMREEVGSEEQYFFKFKVQEVLNKRSPTFDDDLLASINLLQENVGSAGVYESEASLSDYLKTVHVNWEILPPGERQKNIAEIISRFRVKSDEDRNRIIERYDTLSKLSPVAFISGTSGFRRYFGAKFSETLIVFENLEYGNAIYVMYENWEKLSKKNRIELLTGDNRGFDRVVHSENWKNLLRFFVESAREKEQGGKKKRKRIEM